MASPPITKEERALGFKPRPPPGKEYCIEPPQGEASHPPIPPSAPEGYIPPGVYQSAALDYGRVALEFGALTGLLLVAWMISYTGGKSNEPN